MKDIPPLYFLLGILLTIPFYFIMPYTRLIPFPYILIGIIFILIGGILNLLANAILKKHNTPHKFQPSTCCVQTGIFKVTRNPMYAGMVSVVLGMAILTGNLVSFISPIALFLILQYKFIPYEEDKMKQTFGKEYIDYMDKVHRWI